MARQTEQRKPPLPRPGPATPSAAKATKATKAAKAAQRKPRAAKRQPAKCNSFLLIIECLALVAGASLLTMLALGHWAHRFSGSGFFSSLLPFSFGIVVLIVAAAAFLIAWSRIRLWLLTKALPLPSLLALSMAIACLWYIFHGGYTPVFGYFRTMVGGKQQAASNTLSHQVFAAYRRYDEKQLLTLIARSSGFEADIRQAARHFELDADILLGVAATESSFMPRDSRDGGHGLFQITAVPQQAIEQARRALATDKLSPLDSRHNAFLAAATLKHYLQEMHDDLFLGLLAYNIGPRNGGLRFIMQQYGAGDFVSMQPYLQQLPRDYPIRVLSYALAFRIWRYDGKLLAYQEGDNAVHIQRIGIPGLSGAF